MAQCPRDFRKHLVGINALIRSSAGGNRCEALHGAYQKYVCTVGQNKVLWRWENSLALWLFTLWLSSCAKCLQTQTVSQMTSSQNGCNSRSCSPILASLCRDGDEATIRNSSQESKKILLLMVDQPDFFPYLFMPDVGINIWSASTLTPVPSNGELIKSQSAKPRNLLCTHRVQDKQLMW